MPCTLLLPETSKQQYCAAPVYPAQYNTPPFYFFTNSRNPNKLFANLQPSCIAALSRPAGHGTTFSRFHTCTPTPNLRISTSPHWLFVFPTRKEVCGNASSLRYSFHPHAPPPSIPYCLAPPTSPSIALQTRYAPKVSRRTQPHPANVTPCWQRAVSQPVNRSSPLPSARLASTSRNEFFLWFSHMHHPAVPYPRLGDVHSQHSLSAELRAAQLCKPP